MRPQRLPLVLCLVLAASASPAQTTVLDPVAPAAEATPSDPAPQPRRAEAETRRAEIEARRAEVAAQVEALREQLGAEGEAAPGLALELGALELLEATYARQLGALERAEALSRRADQSEARLAEGPRGELAEPPPYGLAVFDALADARDAQRLRTTAVEQAVDAAAEVLETAEAALQEAERSRRQAQEDAEQTDEGSEGARLAAALRRSRIESRQAEAARDLARLERENLERELAIQRQDEQLLDETVAWLRDNLAVGADSLKAPLDRLDDIAFENQRRLEQAERELAAAERRLSDAERRLEAAPRDPVRTAEVEARRAARRLWQERATSATAILAIVERARENWGRRVRVLSGQASRPELVGWEEELERQLAEWERNRRLVQARQAELERELEQARRRLEAASPAAERWLSRRVRDLEALRELRADVRRSFEGQRPLFARTLGEIRERTARASLLDRLRAVARASQEFWRTEIFAVDDRSITAGKIIGAILLFSIGFAIARAGSRLMGWLLRARLTFDSGAASAVQALLFYLLLALFTLLALRTVNIPLTAFTVLGGALAIGVGFGSQNVVNNFISGLILLAERPIKEGDLIEVDGTKGYVERIGPRSTRVRTFENIHIIVPNSAFLEKNVVNWTLSDADIRTHVDVGVAYGSPTREVSKLMRRAMDEHGKIMDKPAPVVWFIEFGDNALVFRGLFWIRSSNMAERLTIESDIRHRIDHLFRDAGITIAFPQRDVHLDAREGIEVRLVDGSASGRDA